jgi:hypothetical protein
MFFRVLIKDVRKLEICEIPSYISIKHGAVIPNISNCSIAKTGSLVPPPAECDDGIDSGELEPW